MIGARHFTQSPCRMYQDSLRGGKGCAGVQKPGKIKRVYADAGSGAAELVDFDLSEKITAVDKAEAIDMPVLLAGIFFRQNKKRVVLMTAGTSGTFDGCYPGYYLSGNKISFPGPGPGKLHHPEVAVIEIDCCTQGPQQADIIIALIYEHCMAGYDIKIIEHAVNKVDLQF